MKQGMSTKALRIELIRMADALAGMVRRQGIATTGRALGGILAGHAMYPVTIRRRADERFTILGHELPYTFSRYNNTFRNERSVEISVAKWFLGQTSGSSMLEVGNVLSHYGIVGHDVVDRYEVVPGVINADIVDFSPATAYEIVVSISTLEHVGRDETPCDPERAVMAFENLQTLAAPAGRILVTLPIGYNAQLDDAIRDGRVRMPVQTVLERVDATNRWVETSLESGLSRSYGTPFNNANAVYVGMQLDSERRIVDP